MSLFQCARSLERRKKWKGKNTHNIVTVVVVVDVRTLFSTHIIQANSLFSFTHRVLSCVCVCVFCFIAVIHAIHIHMESIFSNFEQTHWPSNLDKRALSVSFAIRRAKTYKQMDMHTRCRERWTRTRVVRWIGMCRCIVCLKHSKTMRIGNGDGRHEVTRDWCDGCARSKKFKYDVVVWTDPLTLKCECRCRLREKEWDRERVFEEASIALLRASFIT